MEDILFYLDLIENFDSKKPERPMPEDVYVVYSTDEKQQKTKYTKDKPKCIVAYFKNDAIVWFRGTRVTSVNDLRLDFTMNETKFLNGMCHNGFLQGTRRVIDDILPYLYGKERITFIGHSLGGACAALAALIFHYEKDYKNVRALTLACPGIVSENIAKLAEPIVTAFVRKLDPIPIIFNYRKGKKYLFKKENAVYCVPGRIFFLDKNINDEVFIRKPEKGDMALTPFRTVNFVAHSRRMYMEDIEYVYGYKSSLRRVRSKQNFICY